MISATDYFLSNSYCQGLASSHSYSYFEQDHLSGVKGLISNKQILMTTTDGGLYMSSFLSNLEVYLLLKEIQDSLGKRITSFGESHPTTKKQKMLEDEPKAVIFLDGDFIEMLLELSVEE